MGVLSEYFLSKSLLGVDEPKLLASNRILSDEIFSIHFDRRSKNIVVPETSFYSVDNRKGHTKIITHRKNGKKMHHIMTMFFSEIQNKLLGILDQPTKYETASDCQEHCFGPAGGGAKCEKCNALIAKSDTKLGPGEDAPLQDDGPKIEDPVTCHDRNDSPNQEIPGTESAPIEPTPFRSNVTSAIGYTCVNDKFQRTGAKRLKADASPYCETDATHGMKYECVKHSLDDATALCNMIPNCNSITGEPATGVYYLRDGTGQKSDLDAWILCTRNGPLGDLPPPQAVFTYKWIPDAVSVS